MDQLTHAEKFSEPSVRKKETPESYAERLQALSYRMVEVQEAERRQIALELHDEIGQRLTGLKLLLETARCSSGGSVAGKLREASEMVDDLLERVQNLSLDLRPAMLDDLGLLHAVLWLIERYSNQSNIGVTFNHTGLEGVRFTPEIETTAYRVIQEALTNVARHAYVVTDAATNVGRVLLEILVDRNTLRLHVQDAGIGFDIGAAIAPGKSTGLASMQERITRVGGQFNLDSSSGSGTQVIAVLPLSREIEQGT